MKSDSAALDTFAEIVKVTSNTRLWNAKLAWYSPSACHQICLYSLIALSAGAAEYINCIFCIWMSVQVIWLRTIWWLPSSNAGALGNAEYPFIAIAPRSTLAQNGSTWQGSIYGSNRPKLHICAKLNCLKRNCFWYWNCTYA